MADYSEVSVVTFFKQVVETEITAIAEIVDGYEKDESEYTDAELKNLIISRCIVETDPFAGFSFIRKDGAKNISTPVILFEIDLRRATLTSNLGSRVYGESDFTIAVMVSRENRRWEVYKNEVITVVNFIEDVFKKQTGKRIVVGNIPFSDFTFKNIAVSSAIIPITTNIKNYDYSIT